MVNPRRRRRTLSSRMRRLTSGESLGSESTSSYLSPYLKGDKLLIGANFASAGIEILNDTGIQFTFICSLGCAYFTLLGDLIQKVHRRKKYKKEHPCNLTDRVHPKREDAMRLSSSKECDTFNL